MGLCLEDMAENIQNGDPDTADKTKTVGLSCNGCTPEEGTGRYMMSRMNKQGFREGRAMIWRCDCYEPNSHPWWIEECPECAIRRPLLAWQNNTAVLFKEEMMIPKLRHNKTMWIRLSLAVAFLLSVIAIIMLVTLP